MSLKRSLLILNSLDIETPKISLDENSLSLLVDGNGTPLILKKGIIDPSSQSELLSKNNKVSRKTDLILTNSRLNIDNIRQPEDFQDRLYMIFDDFLFSFQDETKIDKKRGKIHWHQRQARKFLENFN